MEVQQFPLILYQEQVRLYDLVSLLSQVFLVSVMLME